MKIVAIFLSLLLLAGFYDCKKTSQNSGEPEWKLIFQDDFSETSVDRNHWGLYDSPGNSNFGLRRPDAINVSDGNLVITAQMLNGNLVSGGMSHNIYQTYGKYEFRVRTENDPSEATSGVILTWPKNYTGPIDGENDMYETGTEIGRPFFHTFIHYGYTNNTQYSTTHAVDATQWHTVGMEWTSKSIKIYRDNALVWTITDEKAIPDVPHCLCVQLDSWKSTMTGVVRMYVDWVKVYSIAE